MFWKKDKTLHCSPSSMSTEKYNYSFICMKVIWFCLFVRQESENSDYFNC